MHSIGLGLLRLVTWGTCVDIYVTNLLMDGEKACPVSVLVTRIYSVGAQVLYEICLYGNIIMRVNLPFI